MKYTKLDKPMSEDNKDKAAWTAYLSNTQVRPIEKPNLHKVAKKPVAETIINKPLITAEEVAMLSSKPLPIASVFDRGISDAQARRIDRGKLELDGKLDLHGFTKLEAMELFINYVNNAYAQGRRMLLVITGKGKNSQSGQGKLREAMLEWIDLPQVAAKILRCSPAAPKHGGSGAFYIFLRKNNGLASR